MQPQHRYRPRLSSAPTRERGPWGAGAALPFLFLPKDFGLKFEIRAWPGTAPEMWACAVLPCEGEGSTTCLGAISHAMLGKA